MCDHLRDSNKPPTCNGIARNPILRFRFFRDSAQIRDCFGIPTPPHTDRRLSAEGSTKHNILIALLQFTMT